MDRIWQHASTPALHALAGAQGLEVFPNEAAVRWAARRGIEAADWLALAAERWPADAPEVGEAFVGRHRWPLGCRRVPLADGSVLFWLDPGVEAQDERSALVAEAMGVGFWSRDIDAGSGYWDEQMYRIHRRAPSAGPPPYDQWVDLHVHAADRGWVAELHRRANESWLPVVDATFRVPDGEAGERWVQTWTRRLLRNGHRLAFGMHLDVTERERDRLLLQRERERMRFALDAAEVGVWERDLDGRIVHWSDAIYRLRGVAPDDPRTPDEIAEATSHPDDHEGLKLAVGRHVRDGAPYRFEFRVRLPDGRWRWLLTQGRALRDAHGQVVGMAGINYDLSERKEAEALRLEKARAEQASRDKSAFMARLSHELRTPMNAVLGFTQLLDTDAAEPPSARQQGRLRRIAEAGARMMALVDDLLDLASAETTEPASSTEPVPLADVLQQACDALGPEAARLGLALRTRIASASPCAAIDRRRLVQALVQVGGHVLRRQRAGATVEFVLDALADDHAALTVHDHGPACDAAGRAMLFEPFAHGAPSDDAGTGLGLALARRLVESSGGTLDARAGPAGGTEFVIDLPIVAAAAAPGDVDALRPISVLCVEDNPVNLLLVRELLSMRPLMKLHEAVDGASGIAAALAHRPDLLLLDLQLPDIHGVEVLRRLRAEPALSHSTFVALSANAMPEQIAAARAAGFDDYWTKPIDFAHFLSGIDRISQGARRSRSQAPASTR